MSLRGGHILLIGTMGAGKTTIGQLLAEQLQRRFLDNDDLLLKRTGARAAELLHRSGEAALHQAELEILAEQVASPEPSVLALAGSALGSETGRALIKGSGQVVYLRADPKRLARRVRKDSERPIDGDLEATLAERQREREPFSSALADVVVEVGEDSPETVVALVRAGLVRKVHVSLDERSYEVLVGPGVRQQLSEVLPTRARRAAIVTQQGIDYPIDPGMESFTCVIGDGEQAKSLATIEQLCRSFSQAGLTRSDVVIGLGGGVVSDVAGFAAACYHRGVDVVQVSTTLLGQVDAAVGGKTGVNLPEGKNLVGAFWQPHAVLCDTDTLVSLPERELRSGQGEMAKYAFLGVEDLDQLNLVEQIARCLELKAAVVASDEREGDARMLLNYGHTLAHALEAAGFADGPGKGGVDLRHGEAVAIGLVFAAQLAHLLGRIDAARVQRHLEVVRAYDLPETIPAGVDHEELLRLMARDKKATGGLTFVLDGPAGVKALHSVPEQQVRAALVLLSQGPQPGDRARASR